MAFIDPLGLDTLGVHELNMKTYKENVDVVRLDEVSVTASKSSGSGGRYYGGDGSGSFSDRFMYGLDEVNQYLPTTHVLNSISYAFTGRDIMGNNMSLGGATLGAVSVLPIGKIGRVAGNTAMKFLPKGMIPNAGGKIVTFTTTEVQTYYRVYSSGANGGAFLTKAVPKSSAFAIEGLALPSTNTASFIQQVTVPAGVTLQRSRALSAFGKRGGLEQFQILNFDSRIIFHPGTPFK